MNVPDIVLLALGCWSVIRGLFRGLSGEVLSLVAAIGGSWCSLRFYPSLASVLSEKTGITIMPASAISVVAIFAAIFIICSAVRLILKKALRAVKLSWLDRLLGAGAGFIKIYLIALVALVAGMMLAPAIGSEWVEESMVLSSTAKTWPHVSPVLDAMGLLPDIDKLRDEAQSYIERQAGRALFGETERVEPDAPAASDDVELEDLFGGAEE